MRSIRFPAAPAAPHPSTLSRRRLLAGAVLLSTLTALGGADPAAAKYRARTVRVPPVDAAALDLGTYSGPVGFRLGAVRDASGAEADLVASLRGRKYITALRAAPDRARAFAQQLAAVLDATGLGAGTETVYRLDATLLLDRYTEYYQLPRAEVFVRFDLTGPDGPVGSVLACGNAQQPLAVSEQQLAELMQEIEDPQKAQTRLLAKVLATDDREGDAIDVYRAAVADALDKLFSSRTFRELAGDGWTPGTGPADPEGVTRIDKTVSYGPPDDALESREPFEELFRKLRPERLVLVPVRVDDPKYLAKLEREAASHERDLERGREPDPGLGKPEIMSRLRQHLAAFYPGAFPEIVLDRDGRTPLAEGDLRISGSLARFDPGGNNNRLAAALELSTPDRGTIFTLRIDWTEATPLPPEHARGETTWHRPPGTGMMGEMEDYLARGLAYLLVTARPGGYTPPAGLEILFDGTPYPPEAEVLEMR